jgi:hypothetical protein
MSENKSVFNWTFVSYQGKTQLHETIFDIKSSSETKSWSFLFDCKPLWSKLYTKNAILGSSETVGRRIN